MIALVLWMAIGQQPCSGGEPPKNPPDCIPAEKMVIPQAASIKFIAIGDLHCADNQHIEGDGKSENGNRCVDDAPLKCPKYQHVDHRDGYWGGADCGGLYVCASIAVYHPEVNVCVDDMHEVTEREWQELMARLKKFESAHEGVHDREAPSSKQKAQEHDERNDGEDDPHNPHEGRRNGDHREDPPTHREDQAHDQQRDEQ